MHLAVGAAKAEEARARAEARIVNFILDKIINEWMDQIDWSEAGIAECKE